MQPGITFWRLVCGRRVVGLPVGLNLIGWPLCWFFCIWTLLGKIGVISPSRVVNVWVGIITRSEKSCIDLLIRNISIIDSSRIVIYLMHSARTEWAWFKLGAYVSNITSKASNHQLIQLLGDSINYLGGHVWRLPYFEKTLRLWCFRYGCFLSVGNLLTRIVTQVFKHSPCFIFAL